MARDYTALVTFLEASARRRFDYRAGQDTHDCVRFAAGAVEAQTGINPLKGLTWSSEKAARALLANHGGLCAAVDSKLTPIPVGMAQRGDIGLVVAQGQETLCVVEGSVVVAPTLEGQVRLPRALMSKAWAAA